MTTLKRIFVIAVLAAVLGIAGCGGDEEGKPIPAQTAQALQSELDGVQRRLDNGSSGACRDILEGERGPNMERVRELIDSLPDDVDPDVRQALEDSFDHLWGLVQQDCDEKAADEEEAEPEPEPDPEPTPTDTAPVETDTTPTDTTPTDTTPTTPEEAPLPPEGDGNNNGEVPGENGNGNGGGVGPG